MHPTILYLHGFASGPDSEKGVAVARHFERECSVRRLDLRVPTFETMLPSAMLEVTRTAIAETPADSPVVLFGSSLGGLTAARAAAGNDRVRGLILLAPAFGFTARWRERLGPDELAAWRASGWLSIDDYALRRKAQLHYAFITDAERLDREFGPAAPAPATPSFGSTPTLVVHGDRDDVVPVSGSIDWARENESVRLVRVDDGHSLTASLPVILREADALMSAVQRGR
ncbi:MAG: YqiA/YcfP family alpha/beta fold hydrolase [Polyangiaceae bacterium]